MSKEIRIFASACLIFFLVGCDSPKLNKLNDSDVILAFGDSLTAGVGTVENNSYPTRLSELSGMKVINAGVSGETTSEGLARLPRVIKKHDPNLLILLEGGNDILRKKNYSQIEKNLNEMIQIALNQGVQVVLIGVPEKSLFANSAPFYQDLADKHNLVYDAGIIGSLMRSPAKKSDLIHFNEEGYSDMADQIYELISNNGAFD